MLGGRNIVSKVPNKRIKTYCTKYIKIIKPKKRRRNHEI